MHNNHCNKTVTLDSWFIKMQVVCLIWMSVVSQVTTQLWDISFLHRGNVLEFKNAITPKVKRSTTLSCCLWNNDKLQLSGAAADTAQRLTKFWFHQLEHTPTKTYCSSNSISYWSALNTTPPALSYGLCKQQKIDFCHSHQSQVTGRNKNSLVSPKSATWSQWWYRHDWIYPWKKQQHR